jgi:hypothetical protein
MAGKVMQGSLVREGDEIPSSLAVMVVQAQCSCDIQLAFLGFDTHASIIGCQAPGFVQRAAVNPARSGRKQR